MRYVTFSIDVPDGQLVHDNVFPKEWPFGKHKEHNVKTILLHFLIPWGVLGTLLSVTDFLCMEKPLEIIYYQA